MTVAVAVWMWNRCILATDWRVPCSREDEILMMMPPSILIPRMSAVKMHGYLTILAIGQQSRELIRAWSDVANDGFGDR